MKKDYTNLHRGLVLKYFWQVIRGFKFSFFTMIISNALPFIFDIIIPLQYLKLWNVISAKDFLDIDHARAILFGVLALHAGRYILRRVADFSDDYFTSNVMRGLRNQAFSYMIGHPALFFADNFGGSLVQKISKYANAFRKLKDKILSDGFPIIIRSIGTIIAVYALLPHKYAYLFAAFFFVFIFSGIILSKFKLKYDIAAAELDSKTTGALADSITNHSSIQFFTGHDYEKKHVGAVINNQYKATLLNWRLWDSIFAVQAIFTVAIEIGIFWIAIEDWYLGLIGLPIFIILQTYLNNLISVLWNWASLVRTYYEGFSDAQEMATILDMPYKIVDRNNSILENIKGDISFEDVTYIYDKNNTKVLDKFSIKITAGQKVALVGKSGAGKTTLVRLIMRLFDVTGGKITVDGINISDVTQKNLREKIAFVPQDTALFHRTLMENIRYGRRDATDEEVKRAASLAHCDEFIERLPLKYETHVGERGVKLSGGERQRVAIARAILKDAPILILDEATSSLDSHSEMLIQDALHNLIKNKTTIIIAHRLSTIRQMDRIVVLEEGKIVEDGTHDDLLNKDMGVYKKLWDLQAGGFLEE
ncbi:MAG: ABC transporter ATP-binding protein [Candidatus Pacebacteria bacterium]|nr:ABC transporter ATP-binding protein [Candidatus Paceibacterota bacterium]